MNNDRYLKGSKAIKILNVHTRTLYNWEKKGWIETKRTKGGMRLYNVDKYLRNMGIINIENECLNDDEINDLHKSKKRLNISYVRVSSTGQKDDLERQLEMVKKKYPKNKIIKDIGSGINLNRKGLRKIIDLAIEGKIKTLVVAYKDRLTRFGFELIEDLIKKYSNGKIIVIEQKDVMEPEEELVKDVLQLMNVFVAKMNGLRKYKKRKEKIGEHKN